MRFVPAVAAVLALSATPVVAQIPATLLGERVRVHTVQGAAVVGRLSRLDADTVVVTEVRKNQPSEVAVPLGYISRVERSLGQSPDFMRGLGAGVTTALLTLGLGLVYDELFVPDGWESSGPSPALIAGTSAAVGLATAFLRKRDRWAPAALPAVTPVVGASHGGALLGLSVGF